MIARFLQWALDDERLKPRERREVHPIPEDPPTSTDPEVLRQYCFTLQCRVALLWEQVWWMDLPFYKRWAWRYLGFEAPIRRFYLKP